MLDLIKAEQYRKNNHKILVQPAERSRAAKVRKLSILETHPANVVGQLQLEQTL